MTHFDFPISGDPRHLQPNQPTSKHKFTPSNSDLSDDFNNLDLVSNRISSMTEGLGSSSGSQHYLPELNPSEDDEVL